MAYTRTQILSNVRTNTGRDASSRASLCDEALKIAVHAHPFRDSISTVSIAIASGDYEADISSISNLVHIVTAVLIDSTSRERRHLVMKNATWWDRNIIDGSLEPAGLPTYGLRAGNTIKFDRPSDRAMTLRLSVSTEVSFASDNSECPIPILDVFVEQYVTAMFFRSIGDATSYVVWKSSALGPQWDAGVVGGTLKHAIELDKLDLCEEHVWERYPSDERCGIAIRNLLAEHSDYGNIRLWY